MKEEILLNQDNPMQLEQLYRQDKGAFRRAFRTVYPQVESNSLLGFWQVRLENSGEDISWGSRKELLFVLVAALIAGFLAKLPTFTGIDEEYYYTRNIGFILFPVLTAYFAWKNKATTGKLVLMGGLILAGLVFINAFPGNPESDTLQLSCIHLLLFLWSVLGFSYVGEAQSNDEKRLGFLKYNGDLVVMTTLILIAGGIMTGLTIGLFSLIGFQIENFYFENIVLFGLPAAPILGTYLTQTNPHLVGKVSPVIAKIFSPLVLVMLVVYFIAMGYSGKDPYNDREFLLLFNALLIGVMAIIFFSVAGTTPESKSRMETGVLFLLSLVTIIVNGIALSAILFRISEMGMTPNRAAVMGGNLLILGNLLLVTVQLFRVLRKKSETASVGNAIAGYLPIYFVWTIIVTFLFPLLFGFR